MKTLKISDNKALELYKTASNELKEILEETFGKDFFKPKDIRYRINNIDDILEITQLEMDDIIPFKKPKNAKQRSINAYALLLVIVEVYNDGEILDWNNQNQYKYFAYYKPIGIVMRKWRERNNYVSGRLVGWRIFH